MVMVMLSGTQEKLTEKYGNNKSRSIVTLDLVCRMRDGSVRLYEMHEKERVQRKHAEDCFRKQNMPACHPLSIKLSHNNREKKEGTKKRQPKK